MAETMRITMIRILLEYVLLANDLRSEPWILRVVNEELSCNGSKAVTSPYNPPHEENGHSRMDLIVEVELRHRDWGIPQIISGTRRGGQRDQNMLLDAKRPWVEAEAPRCKWYLDGPSGEYIGQPDASIT